MKGGRIAMPQAYYNPTGSEAARYVENPGVGSSRSQLNCSNFVGPDLHVTGGEAPSQVGGRRRRRSQRSQQQQQQRRRSRSRSSQQQRRRSQQNQNQKNTTAEPSDENIQTEQWPPMLNRQWSPGKNIFTSISENDILLHHPYESFEPVIALVEQSATDPKVLAIKQTLYRTANNSRVISALIRAAENGKQVTVVVELKARFDEARNLERADELEKAGVQIIYGVKGYKTHCKITLVVRNENNAKNISQYFVKSCRISYGFFRIFAF